MSVGMRMTEKTLTPEGVSKHWNGSEDGDILSFQKHTTAIRVEAQQAGTESD